MKLRGLSLILLTLSSFPSTFAQTTAGWQAVGPGLLRKEAHQGHRRSISYRANTPLGRERLHALLSKRKPAALQSLLLLEKSFKPHLVRSQAGSCDFFGTGYAGTEAYDVYLSVGCASGVKISGRLVVEPPPNTDGGYRSNFYSALTSMEEEIMTNCDPNAQGCVGDSEEPDDWATEESYFSDQGDEGYSCQVGDDFPSACPY